MYGLLKPHVTKVAVCNPRMNALPRIKTGNQDDRIDARKLAEQLRGGLLPTVYHGETGLLTLQASRLVIGSWLPCSPAPAS